MIDIIIPLYNAHDTIVKTLASVAMQSIKSQITVYLIDDNSIIDYQTEIKDYQYNEQLAKDTFGRPQGTEDNQEPSSLLHRFRRSDRLLRHLLPDISQPRIA